MHNLLQDMRFASRILRKSPGFALVAIATLALGIGVNSVMFGALNAFLLRPFPFRDPDRLMMVWEKNPKLEGFLAERVPTCLKNYFEWRGQAKSFEDLAAYQDANFALTGVATPEQLVAEKASPNFFNMLGVRPVQGRTFSGDDGIAGKDRLVVLTNDFYQKHFGHDANVVGRDIELDGQHYSIIGVLPPSFKLPGAWGGLDAKKPQLFVPLNTSANQPDEDLQDRKLFVFARLKPGTKLENARAEMDVIGKHLEQKYPQLNQGFGSNVFSLRTEDVDADLQLGLLILQGFVGLVLLIACANIANLLLARAAGREKEMAVRSALGASRGRIVRQILAESMVLSLAGGFAGLVLARWGLMALNRFTPEDVLGAHDLTLDFTVFGFTFAVVAFAGLVFGIVPALYSSRKNINETLTRNSRSATGRAGKVRSALVVMETAIAVLLVTGAGLMARSLLALHSVNPGFDSDYILTARLALPQDKYSKPDQVRAFCAELMEKARTIPGVQSAALASGLPMQNISAHSFHLESQENHPSNEYLVADFALVTEDYFAALGTPIVRGRGFTRQEAEQAEPGVMVVNESMARKFWPNQDALGKAILTGDPGKFKRNVIVGIVADSHQLTLDVPTRPQMFEPTRSFHQFSIVLRTAGDPKQLANALTAQVLSIDKDRPVTEIKPMSEIVTGTMSEQRFGTSLMIGFAVLALLLASVGLYGVLAYVVSQRTPEIGIRMALGAQRADVLRMVLRHGLVLALAGVAIGIALALAATRLMSSLLYGISARDPLTFLATAFILVTIAMIATYIPAWRATRVDPLVALRYE
jgi:putative ABC transport system permease protein